MTGALHLSFFSRLTIFGNFETCVTNHVFVSEPGVGVWMRWRDPEISQCRE